MAGYRTVLCRNSFIFHYGNKSFGRESAVKQCQMNREVFKQKWGFHAEDYTYPKLELIAFMTPPIKVLEIGCGWGATLSKIKYLYPDAVVKGVEQDEQLARIGANSFDIIQGDIENTELPFEKGYFDYILFADTLGQMRHPERVLFKIKEYLNTDGHILCSVPNIMHASVLLPLLKGDFSYREEGILNPRNIKLFTLQSICDLLEQTGYRVEAANGYKGNDDLIAQDKEFAEGVRALIDESCADYMDFYQFAIKAKA
jgi:SAM-dependent methyltransferase